MARTPSRPLAAALVTLAAGMLAYAPARAGILDLLTHGAGHAAPAPAQEPLNPAPALKPGQAPDYRAIVRQYGPAVVGVTVEGTHRISMEQCPGPQDSDPFFQFFRGLPWQGPRSGEEPFRGQGSGFIVSSDGLILTNAHVVRDAQEVMVKFADRRELKAKVLGEDPATDIAVLKVQARDLPTVRFGDPKSLQVGDYVLAIGAPFGFDQSATAGIVSAKGRSLPGDAYVPFIQTDAAVNPGNSGGPLFDAAGDVVGINAQIYSQSGGYQGLSFAIPIDVALRTKSQIVSTGHASHARLGVMVQDLDQGLADSFGLKRPDGALVANVEPDSPAARAGVKAGDVITQVEGSAVGCAGDLSSRIGMDMPGDRVSLTIWRDHSGRELQVKLSSAAPEVLRSAAPEQGSGDGRLGLDLRQMTPQERSSAGVDHGLVVRDVGGPSARAGIQPGDILLGIDGSPARSVDQVRNVMRGRPKSVALLIERNGERIFVPVQLG